MTLPRATYRLQFRNGMTFDRAAELAPYWKRLGVSHLYASPIFAARSGSTHGYDVTDHNSLDPALGGADGFRRMSAALKTEGLGLILDIVPNHMCAVAENPWWASVLAWGRQSPYAGHFDIDWDADRLLLPVLGCSFDEALTGGELELTIDDDAGHVALSYYGFGVPLAPATYIDLLTTTGDDNLADVARAFVAADTEAGHRGLAQAMRAAPCRDALTAALRAASADQDGLRRLHNAQAWRLAFWQEGRHSLTYRRFFEITDLIGVRVEEEPVFEDVHRLLLDLVREGHVDGVRVDHVDGLADPTGYLRRLREAVGPDTYLVVEKILEGDEAIRADWPIDGTTGYEFVPDVARVMCDAAQAPDLTARYLDFVGMPVDYAETVRTAKRDILTHNLAAELTWLVRRADDLVGDVPVDDLRQAIVGLMSRFPRYRTYVDEGGADPTDAALIATIATEAGDDAPAAAIEAIVGLLLLDVPDPQREAALEFVRRFQQTTGPVMAKAVEDTTFYRYNRLIGLNEVGGDPLMLHGDDFGCLSEVPAVDPALRSMATTATHDTKRGEDARARLYVLSEVPVLWNGAARRWTDMNAHLAATLDDGIAPGRNMTWMIYQALFGVWPLDLEEDEAELAALAERLSAFVEKAVREAKQRTSWLAPDDSYETAVKAYVAGLLAPAARDFRADFRETCAPLWRAGAINSVAQVLLKLAAPRVPDIYQGTELWDFALVDPDNRRDVDFAARDVAVAGGSDALWTNWRDGQVKLQAMQAALAARTAAPRLYAEGASMPLAASGEAADHVFALLRRLDDQVALLAVPRLVMPLLADGDVPRIEAAAWDDTELAVPDDLAGRSVTDVLTGREITLQSRVRLADLFAQQPVALLQGS